MYFILLSSLTLSVKAKCFIKKCYWKGQCLNELYHRRVFINVCLQIDPEYYEWGLSAKSTVANDTRRVNQTMFPYFKRAANFKDKHYPGRSVHDVLRICHFDITFS